MSNPNNVCRLCIAGIIEISQNGKSLYDASGQTNELHQVVSKYFHPQIVDMDEAKHLNFICLKCWTTIYDFQSFQADIVKSQLKLLDLATPLCNTTSIQLNEVHIKTDYEDNESVSLEDVECCETSCVDINQIDPNLHIENPRNLKFEKMDITESSLVIGLDEISDTDSTPLTNNATIEQSVSESSENEDPDVVDCSNRSTTASKGYTRVSVKVSAAISKTFVKPIKETTEYLVDKFLRSIKCGICAETFLKFDHLKQHIVSDHHKKSFSAECCSKKMSLKKLREHVILHRDPDAFKCGLCGGKFGSKTALKHHVTVKHPEYSKFLCQICKHASESYQSLLDHYAGKHQTDPPPKPQILANGRTRYPCSECENMSPNLQRFYHHYWFAHKGLTAYIPEVQENLKVNENVEKAGGSETPITVSQGKPHLSSLSKAVSGRVDASREEAVNQWLPSIQCGSCPNIFGNLNELREHYHRIHSGEKVHFTCCNRTFSIDCIKDHALMHSDPKIFKCDMCDRSFSSMTALKIHGQKRHPEYTSFDCKLCEHVNNSYTGLVAHYSSEHQSNPPPKPLIQVDGLTRFPCFECEHLSNTILPFYHHYWFEHKGIQKVKRSPEGMDRNSNNCGGSNQKSRTEISQTIQQCPDCEKSFPSDRDMIEHLASVHRNIILYLCPCCPQTFGKVTHIPKHRREEHPHEPKVDYYKNMDDIFDLLLQESLTIKQDVRK